MLRFLLLAVPIAVCVLALAATAVDLAGLGPDLEPLDRRGLGRAESLPRGVAAAALVFEGLALVALYLLVAGRLGAWWLDGLATGFAAWIFRGPLLVLAVAALTRLPTEPFWQLARGMLVAEPAAALAVAALARRMRLPGSPP
jgi:hypothetical protein